MSFPLLPVSLWVQTCQHSAGLCQKPQASLGTSRSTNRSARFSANVSFPPSPLGAALYSNGKTWTWRNRSLLEAGNNWGKNPSYELFAQFHPLCKAKCYKQQKVRKLLWDAGKYSVSKCNGLYTDKTHWVCTYTVMWSKLPIITQERDLAIITWSSLKASSWMLGDGKREKQCQGWLWKKWRTASLSR